MSDDVTLPPAPPAPPALPAAPPPRRRRFGLGALLITLALVGTCAPLCMVAVGSVRGGGSGTVPDAVVLELDLEQPVVEGAAGGGLLAGPKATSTRDIVFALEAAAADPRVKGLYARVGGAGHGLATAMEIRDAVLAFKKSGKPTLAFSESFGELSPGIGGWFIATAFDEVWLQPAGMVSLSPLSGEAMFVRDALAKLGVEPTFAARKEYKNAVNTFTEQGLTAAHIEAMSTLLTSAQQQLVAGIVRDRAVVGDAAAVEARIASGPHTDTLALEHHLVDTLGYRDEALAAIAKKAGVDVDARLWLSKYLERNGSPYDDKLAPGVAVVDAIGQIHRGAGNNDPLSGTTTVGSDTVGAALRKAIADDDIKAIVLRIDSPGGSVVASETIAHEVQRARAAGKPVIASMANVAGSGGYYIAMNADAIVAQPGTITGSIGVYAGKMVTTKLWEQLGVNFDTIAVGDADVSFFSTDAPYSEAALARLNEMVDGIYSSFVTKVAAGRKKSFDEIEPVARGRIWSGADAQPRGLVDTLGGWPQTLAAVRTALKLAPDAKLHVRSVPEALPPFVAVLQALRGSDGEHSDDDGIAQTNALDATTLRASLKSALLAASREPVQALAPITSVLP